MFSPIQSKSNQKKALLNVIAPVAFWSYDKSRMKAIPDARLIEAVLIHGNDPLRKRLFNLFPQKKIKKIWEREMIIRGSRFEALNKKIASEYLHIANPDRHIKKVYSKYNLYDRFSTADA